MTKDGLLNPYLGSQQWLFSPRSAKYSEISIISLKAVQSQQGPVGPLLNTSSGPSSAE